MRYTFFRRCFITETLIEIEEEFVVLARALEPR